MRITAEARQRTRERLLDAARELFASKGFAATTTRDLAHRAGVATGTLFNYFAGKEALALALIEDAVESAHDAFLGRPPRASCPEALFAHVAAELRHLAPFRPFVADVVALASGPAMHAVAASRLRSAHMEIVNRILAEHGLLDAVTPVSEELYWTLYTGVMTFWSRDGSRGQSETLALLDEALDLFVRALTDRRAQTRENDHVPDDR